jgi:hypothetical protein
MDFAARTIDPYVLAGNGAAYWASTTTFKLGGVTYAGSITTYIGTGV